MKEHAPQGTLALVSDMASSAVTGMAGLAKAALVGREDGYRAGADHHAASLLRASLCRRTAVGDVTPRVEWHVCDVQMPQILLAW